MKLRDLIDLLKKDGWKGPERTKKHDKMVKGDRAVIIPRSHNGTDSICVDVVRKILKAAGIIKPKST